MRQKLFLKIAMEFLRIIWYTSWTFIFFFMTIWKKTLYTVILTDSYIFFLIILFIFFFMSFTRRHSVTRPFCVTLFPFPRPVTNYVTTPDLVFIHASHVMTPNQFMNLIYLFRNVFFPSFNNNSHLNSAKKYSHIVAQDLQNLQK